MNGEERVVQSNCTTITIIYYKVHYQKPYRSTRSGEVLNNTVEVIVLKPRFGTYI